MSGHGAIHLGDAWVPAETGEPKTRPNIRVTLEDGTVQWFVREVPVPPLPTDSWSVVRFYGGHFNPAGTVMVLDDSGTWTALYVISLRWNRGDKMKYDRFEVLS